MSAEESTSPLQESKEELSPEAVQNIAIGKQKKDLGDQAFKAGELRPALRGYHEALLYFRGVHKTQPTPAGVEPQDKKKTEVDELMEKVYSNMSACHLKLKNWDRAIETADKALGINENNFKAMFRKAKALGEQGYFEKSVKMLRELLQKNPADAPTINAEIVQVQTAEKEHDQRHSKKYRGFLQGNSKSLLYDDTTDAPKPDGNSEPPESATIEEVPVDDA